MFSPHILTPSHTSHSYYKVTSELLMSVKKTEDSLLKLKAYRKSMAPTPTSGMSDDNKIRLQLALDVEAYSAQVGTSLLNCYYFLYTN